ncbi:hypothetical protein ACFSQE_01615 [Vogesella fluminis]|uniref:hypothetical protein n=1 Tax=Vogesella fluminis TaxID=1069161 RepID=UPI00362E1A91
MSSLPLAEIRRRFFEGETLPDNSVPGPILHSWRRCLGLGLSAARLRLPDKLDAAGLGSRQQENAGWLQLARPAIDALFDSVVDDGHVVIVADRHGVILDQMGHPAFLDRAERVALLPGMDWREDVRGTNAIGTALVLGGPVRVRGSEHYRSATASCRAPPAPSSARRASCWAWSMSPACRASWATRSSSKYRRRCATSSSACSTSRPPRCSSCASPPMPPR